MRPLVRLFLFITVRVSLLLAAVSWVVAQYWGVTATGDFLAWPFRVVNCQEGVAVAWTNTGTNFWELDVLTPTEVGEAIWVFAPSDHDMKTFECTRPFPGVVYLTGSSRWILSAQHWLLISLCLFSYLLLKFAYRRRSDDAD